MRTLILLALMAGFFVGHAAIAAEDEKKPVEPVKPDNTKVNERDRPADRVTADQQGQSKEDVEMTAKIRQAVVKDETLSHSAHNVKIITMNGAVTLKGPVKTEAEKTSVAKKAMEIAGETKVTNEIEILK